MYMIKDVIVYTGEAVHFELKDIITLSLAAVGAVLGVINTWHSLDQRRVRLRVVPKIAQMITANNASGAMGCIEIVNLSAFRYRSAKSGSRLMVTRESIAGWRSWSPSRLIGNRWREPSNLDMELQGTST